MSELAAPALVTTVELALILDVDRTTLSHWAADGLLIRRGTGPHCAALYDRAEGIAVGRSKADALERHKQYLAEHATDFSRRRWQGHVPDVERARQLSHARRQRRDIRRRAALEQKRHDRTLGQIRRYAREQMDQWRERKAEQLERRREREARCRAARRRRRQVLAAKRHHAERDAMCERVEIALAHGRSTSQIMRDLDVDYDLVHYTREQMEDER